MIGGNVSASCGDLQEAARRGGACESSAAATLSSSLSASSATVRLRRLAADSSRFCLRISTCASSRRRRSSSGLNTDLFLKFARRCSRLRVGRAPSAGSLARADVRPWRATQAHTSAIAARLTGGERADDRRVCRPLCAFWASLRACKRERAPWRRFCHTCMRRDAAALGTALGSCAEATDPLAMLRAARRRQL